MRYDVTMLSVNDYVLEELIEELIPEKYFCNDRGEYELASNTVDSRKTVYQLINFLFDNSFQNIEQVPEIYRDNKYFVLELSSFRNRFIDFDYLDNFYVKWIEETGRKNTMDEYGMMLDFIGFTRRRFDKKYLLVVVSDRHASATPDAPFNF